MDADPDGVVSIRMTLTAPNCPVAGSLPGEVERAVRAIAGVTDVRMELTFDPPWSKDRMSPAAKLFLGMEDSSSPLRQHPFVNGMRRVAKLTFSS